MACQVEIAQTCQIKLIVAETYRSLLHEMLS